MTNTAPLADILARARAALAERAGPTRTLASNGAATRFAALLAEIDETVLPRALQFTQGRAKLTVEARSRRAVRISENLPDTIEATELRAALDALKTPREEKLAAMAALLAGFCTGAGKLSVLSQPSALPPSVVDKGFEPEELAEAGAAKLPADDPGDAPTSEPVAPQDAAAEEPAADAKPPAPAPAKPAPMRPRRVSGAKSSTDGDQPLQAFAVAAAAAGASVIADPKGKVRSSMASGTLPIEAKALATTIARQVTLNQVYLAAALPGPMLIFAAGSEGSALGYAVEDAEIAVAAVTPELLDEIATAWRAALTASDG